MRVISFGATRGCGLETISILLQQGGPQMEVHALVRNKEAFLATLKGLSIDSNKLKQLHITVGDALESDKVASFVQSVAQQGKIDAVVSSLGAVPVFNIWKPLTVMPEGSENICRDSMANILAALEKIAPFQEDKTAPRLIVVSSNGMDKTSHDALPWMLKPIYAMIKQPHLDKVSMESLLHQRYNIASSTFNNQKQQVDKNNVYKSDKLFILRPALLTDGKAKKEVRCAEATLASAWNISRKDVGAYIVHNCLLIGEKVLEKRVKDDATSWKGGLVLAY